MPVTAKDLELADLVASCYHDPYRWVMAAYPWGEPGPLQQHPGPDVWQRALLEEIGRQVTAHRFTGHAPVPPIRVGVSSGHGVGKTVEVAWLVDWIMSTRPHAQGTISANTFTQLETKTWAAIQRWTKLCITAHW
ncbi:MAG: terminase, partial [Acidobacteria bacterium]|nr:terminase [Acidobacteriota bacterium]